MYGTEQDKLANEDAERSYADPFAGMPNADDSENEEFSPAKVIRPTRAYDITDRADRALHLLLQAHDAGLPMPGYVSISAHDHGEFRSSGVRFQLADDDEVGIWARHFGRPFVSEKRGSSVTLESSGQHDVQAYYYQTPPPQPPMSDTMSGSYVPGLAEHTQAAPGDRVRNRFTGAIGTVTKASTDFLTVKCDADEEAFCGQRSAFEPFVPGLDAHTQAACDTITKAAQ